MRLTHFQIASVFIIGIMLGFIITYSSKSTEGYQDTPTPLSCSDCGTAFTCPPAPDMSKFVLKSSIPPCPQCPDMSSYMLKTECPPVPDLSHYVLKSSIPKSEPIIIDNSSCRKDCGECPPCPRPRCPDVHCPPPTRCPACPPCARKKCPDKVVKCKTEDTDNEQVRPYLTPLSIAGFGQA